MDMLASLVTQILNSDTKLLINNNNLIKQTRRYAEKLTCSKCLETKPADDFYKTYDGSRHSKCKECQKKYMRESIKNRARKAKIEAKKKMSQE